MNLRTFITIRGSYCLKWEEGFICLPPDTTAGEAWKVKQQVIRLLTH